MVDLNDKKSCEKYEISSTEFKEDNEIKRCADCGTSKTPLWRSGPAGPKTLCNACGIKSRKKRRAMLGLKTEDKKSSKKSNNNSSSSSSSTTTTTTTTTINSSSSKFSGTPLNQRLLAIGKEVMMRRSTVEKHQRKKKLGEDEQAAVLLMALSYGSVYA